MVEEPQAAREEGRRWQEGSPGKAGQGPGPLLCLLAPSWAPGTPGWGPGPEGRHHASGQPQSHPHVCAQCLQVKQAIFPPSFLIPWMLLTKAKLCNTQEHSRTATASACWRAFRPRGLELLVWLPQRVAWFPRTSGLLPQAELTIPIMDCPQAFVKCTQIPTQLLLQAPELCRTCPHSH